MPQREAPKPVIAPLDPSKHEFQPSLSRYGCCWRAISATLMLCPVLQPERFTPVRFQSDGEVRPLFRGNVLRRFVCWHSTSRPRRSPHALSSWRVPYLPADVVASRLQILQAEYLCKLPIVIETGLHLVPASRYDDVSKRFNRRGGSNSLWRGRHIILHPLGRRLPTTAVLLKACNARAAS